MLGVQHDACGLTTAEAETLLQSLFVHNTSSADSCRITSLSSTLLGVQGAESRAGIEPTSSAFLTADVTPHDLRDYDDGI